MHKRTQTYIGLALALSVLYTLLRDLSWQGSTELHTLMETLATSLALFVGVMAIVRFYTRKTMLFLFVGTGFLGTGFLDGYHAAVTSTWFAILFPSPPPSLIPWSWIASRFFLSILLYLSYEAWKREDWLKENRIREWHVYLGTFVLTFASFLFFALVPLPRAYYPKDIFYRPEEFIPAFFFLLALIGYLKKGDWKHDAFEHGLVLSLIVGFLSQIMFMSFSGHNFDTFFDAAHLLKKLSYTCVLTGLIVSMHHLFKREEGANQTLIGKDRLLTSFQQIGNTALSSLDIDQVLDNLVSQIIQVSGFRSILIAQVNDQDHTISVVRALNVRPDGILVDKTVDLNWVTYNLDDNNITPEVARTGKIAVIEGWDDRFDTRLASPEQFKNRVSYFIPVTQNDRTLAVLATGSRKQEREDVLQRIETMQPLLGQIAIALVHARLYGEVQQATEQQTALLEISRSVQNLTNSEGLDRVAKVCYDELQSFGTNFQALAIHRLIDEEAQTFESYLIGPEKQTKRPTWKGPRMYRNWQSGQTIYYDPDLETDAERERRDIEGMRQRFGIQVRCILNISHTGGTISFLSVDPNAFTESDIHFAEQISGILSVGISRIEDLERIEATAVELRRSNEELKQFAYIASHDLQEPLRVITSYLQLLEHRYGEALDEDAQKFVDRSVQGAARMRTLIQDLLTYSRVTTQGKDFESTDCTDVLTYVLNSLELTIQESDASITHDDLPKIKADSTQLEQLLQNLIGNAIKFRGQIPPEVHIGAHRNNGEWTFSVTDNGIGMDPDQAERIFEIFQRLHTRDEYPGTGIGLAVCKKIVERHGGHIWIESNPEQGSTFYFTIPAGK